MTYTKEDSKRYLKMAIESLKSNPACDVPDDELDRRYDILNNDESLEVLANILTILTATL